MMLKLSFPNFLLLIFFLLLCSSKSQAQVIPDNTMGKESSRINSIDELRTRIEGGAIRGDNQFHSFEEFSVRNGLRVDFANPEGINNIFSRVTGNNVSEIFGTLGVDGRANLFLMNPNGIVFGENAAIDVGGSFMATTAESIDFNNGDRFSSTKPNTPSITIDFPVGLGFGSSPGNIDFEGQQNNVLIEIPSFKVIADDLPSGIEVDANKNISLIGGDINFRGSGIKASGGNIELASVGKNETVRLTKTDNWLKLDLTNISQLNNISLKNAAYIDVSGEQAGNIDLSGRKIIVDEGSVIFANTSLSNNNEININASELLEIKGTSGEFEANFSFSDIVNADDSPRSEIQNTYSISIIGADIFSDSSGTGNNINLNTSNLKILDAGQIRTVNFSSDKSFAGDININAQYILVEGGNNIDSLTTSGINSSTAFGSAGNGGDISIVTPTLEVKDGGRIKADSFGIGSGGNLTINSQNISLQGFVRPYVPLITGLYASSPGDNNTGNINISTKNLNITEGAIISSSNFRQASAGNINISADSIIVSGSIPFQRFFPSSIISSVILNKNSNIADVINESNPKAGNINISTKKLKILDGARVEATNAFGSAGSIQINAKNIELNGTRPKVFNFIGGISTSTPSNSSGNGGNVQINTDSLKVLNGSIIRAISLGSGDAGNITINADAIEVSGVDRFAKIPVSPQRVSKINTAAQTANGGNIFINSNSLKVDDQARIVASTNSEGIGGEIFIDSDFISLQNLSQINANTKAGTGGNITINSDSILGLENSDITANAVSGTGGNITINSDAILGLEERSQLTPLGDITASSEFGIDGTVTINSPDIDFENEVFAALIPQTPPQSLKLLQRKCLNPRRKEGKLLYIGRGGVPENPRTFFDDEEIIAIDEIPNDNRTQKNEEPQVWKEGDPIINANKAVTAANGDVYLVAQTRLEDVEPNVCQATRNEQE